MFKAKLTINPRFFQAARDLPRRAQSNLRTELQTTVKPVLQKQADQTFGRDPGPVKKPIDWTTVKQRAAYFASNGFGAGIPYPRTDALRTSWIVDISTHIQRNFITLRNPKRSTKFVYPGVDQQRFHKATGWGRDFDQYADALADTADVECANAWLRAVRAALRNRP